MIRKFSRSCRSLRNVVFGAGILERYFVNRAVLPDFFRNCFQGNRTTEREKKCDLSSFAVLESPYNVLDWSPSLLPSPILGITMPLIYVRWHLVAQLRTEKNQQRNWCQCEDGYVLRFTSFATRFKKPFYSIGYLLLCSFEKSWNRYQLEPLKSISVGSRAGRISRCRRFNDLRKWNLYRAGRRSGISKQALLFCGRDPTL